MRAQTLSLFMNSCLALAYSWIWSNVSLIIIFDFDTSSVSFKASKMESISSSAVAMNFYLALSSFRTSYSANMLSNLYEISMRVSPYCSASLKSFERNKDALTKSCMLMPRCEATDCD